MTQHSDLVRRLFDGYLCSPIAKMLDALYERGWTDLHQKRNFDARGTQQWQDVWDAANALAQQPILPPQERLGQPAEGILANHLEDFLDVEQPAPAPVVVTDAMVERAYEAFCTAPIRPGENEDKLLIRAALTAALGART